MELFLELLNFCAALTILFFVVKLTPTLNLKLQKEAVYLLLLSTTLFSLNEALGVVSLFWTANALEVVRDCLEVMFILGMAAALYLLFQSDRQEVSPLNQAATVDKLTSLHNFGYFKQVATQRVQLAQAANLPLCLILLDADNFKSYNDTFGHEAGNIVLCQIAQHLQDAIRHHQDDVVARYGGEEFVVLLSSSLTIASAMAEWIRATIDSNCRPDKTATLQRAVTVSVGVAQLTPQLKTLEDLIAAADNAMYDAKRAGKNRIKIADAASGKL